MGIQDYQTQILNFFKKNFIEEELGDTKELANVIRQRLMLIEDSEDRKVRFLGTGLEKAGTENDDYPFLQTSDILDVKSISIKNT